MSQHSQLKQSGGENAPLPELQREAQHLLNQFMPHDNVEAFLQTFEKTVEQEEWPKQQRTTNLFPLLSVQPSKGYAR